MAGKDRLAIRGPSSDGKYWWALVSANNETLGHSETYSSKETAKTMALVARETAKVAVIEDETSR